MEREEPFGRVAHEGERTDQMTFKATYQTSAGTYHAYFDASKESKARKFFADWQKKLNKDGFVFVLKEIGHKTISA